MGEELELTYDFDIWGKNRNTWKAALGQVQANLADAAFTQLRISISVAQAYYQLQIDYQRQEIAQALVTNRQKYVELVERRIKANLDSDITLRTAQTNFSAAQQGLLQIQGDIAVREHLLRSYLAGTFEEGIDALNIEQMALPRVPLPYDLPINLLAHRPDITAQLWLIESAGRQIEVAKAGFYPDFNMIALLGLQTIHLHKFFWAQSTYYDVDPAFSLPIFDGGRLRANLRSSEVDYNLAILQYNQLILDATREVLDGIVVLSNTNQQLEKFKEETAYQADLLHLTELRVAHNLDSDLESLTREGNLLTARDQEMVAYGQTLQAVLSLVKALGGGYKACNGEE